MKKQNILLVFVLAALALGACSKYTGTTTNLVGTWDIYSMTQKTYTDGTLDSTSVTNDLGSFTFNSDGTGNYSAAFEGQESSGSFNFFEQNNKVFINLINLSDSVLTQNFAIGFDVKTNTATQQVWSASYSTYEDHYLPTGGTVKQLIKMYMELDLRKR